MAARLKRILACYSGLLLFCTSCSVANPENYGKHSIKTRYKNGLPRTEFSYLIHEAQGEFHLYDSSGNLRVNKSFEDTAVSNSYFPKLSVRNDSANLERISEEITPLLEGLDKKYGKMLLPRFTGKVEYWIWINRNGYVEHAICRRLEKATPSFIQGTIEDIEGWKFSPNLVGSGALVKQQVFFEPYPGRTKISAFALGLATIAVFGYLVDNL